MSGSQIGVLVLGVALVLVGCVVYRVGRSAHADALRQEMTASLRFNLKATQVIGALVAVLGAACVVGSVIGAIFWP